ncbi:hypothetical protein M5C97_21945 [Acidovorax sp. NCPPB 3859]|nr:MULTISPECIES: hypothetical protein [unclassified Acidovorax]MDA8452292.1 hypothetical protein [Acidovorax sp. GBBC 3297]MDA8461738.1 hypothetical protein [Acidovorax sp. GBBC 3333]MDA8466771.1 hypothetical protein [Acidovorax sp. GBBC 3332]MDA8471815.1 hypothetical protein [Acidovorax sp. GBBC 3299]WCM78133.1 hypothetical protein M5C94_21890 [Acidovorax sp. GBBC 712]
MKNIAPYYIISIAFHVICIFTGFGNYFHGGNALEFIVLLAVATIILWQAKILTGNRKGFGKIPILCLAILPAISVVANIYLFITTS